MSGPVTDNFPNKLIEIIQIVPSPSPTTITTSGAIEHETLAKKADEHQIFMVNSRRKSRGAHADASDNRQSGRSNTLNKAGKMKLMNVLDFQWKPDPASVFGPYTPWPPRPRKRLFVSGALVCVAGVFAHCVLPMIG